MSSSRNKSKSGGLRFLWIPGRKKHNRKGHYDTTSKQIKYSGGSFGQKNNAPWSLGGNKGLEKLIESDIPGGSEGGSHFIAALPATYSVAAGASSALAMKLDETNQFPMIDDEKHISNDSDYTKSPDINSVKANNDDDVRSKENNHTNHVEKNDKNHKEDKKESSREKTKDNINSIESLNEKQFNGSSFDIADSSLYVNKYNNKKKNKKKKKKNKQNNEDETDEDPDAQIVKCLYFTLMCCECTIS